MSDYELATLLRRSLPWENPQMKNFRYRLSESDIQTTVRNYFEWTFCRAVCWESTFMWCCCRATEAIEFHKFLLFLSTCGESCGLIKFQMLQFINISFTKLTDENSTSHGDKLNIYKVSKHSVRWERRDNGLLWIFRPPLCEKLLNEKLSRERISEEIELNHN